MEYEDTYACDELRKIVARANLTQAKLAKLAGFAGASSIQRYFKVEGLTDGLLPLNFIRKISSVLVGKGSPPITKAELFILAGIHLDERGQPEEYALSALPSLASQALETISARSTTPIEIASWVKAGSWVESNEIDPDEREVIIWPYSSEPPRGTQAILVSGDSMDQVFPNGSILFARPKEYYETEGRGILNGDYVIARRRNENGDFEYTAKQLEASGNDVLLWPRSNNLMHKKPLKFVPHEVYTNDTSFDDGSAPHIDVTAVIIGAVVRYGE